jgi:hypothetical protein
MVILLFAFANAADDLDSDRGLPPGLLADTYVSHSMELTPDRTMIVDGRGRRVPIDQALERFGDTTQLHTFRSVRAAQRATAGLVIGVGSVVAGYGWLHFLVGLGAAYSTPEHDLSIANSGLAITGFGLLVVGTGITASGVSRAARERPQRWYTEGELDQRLRDYDRNLRISLGLSEGKVDTNLPMLTLRIQGDFL